MKKSVFLAAAVLLAAFITTSCTNVYSEVAGLLTRSAEKSFTSFTFTAAKNASLSSDVAAVIDESTHTITASMPDGTDYASLIATFNVSNAASVTVGTVIQTSSTTSNNFATSISQPIVYTITAENGSAATYKVTLKGSRSYTVNHYQQNIDDDNYTLVAADTQVYAASTGATTAAAAKSYEGFTAQAFEQTTVAEDSSSVVSIYYNRNIVTLTFSCGKGTWSDGTTDNATTKGKYGAAVTGVPEGIIRTGYVFSAWSPAVPETYPSADESFTASYKLPGDYSITYDTNGGVNSSENPSGYNYETPTITFSDASKTGYVFTGWYTDSVFTTPITQIAQGSTGDVTLYAKWTEATDTKYTVEHYQQNTEGSEYTLEDTDNLTGTTNALASYSEKSYSGFTFDSSLTKTTTDGGIIAADGSTVVKLYYYRNEITLTFGPNSGTWSDGTTNNAKTEGRYGAAVTAPEHPSRTGYTFVCWVPAVPSVYPDADTTYTAQWANGTGTPYTVKHYKQNEDMSTYPSEASDTDYLVGETGNSTAATAKTYTGFTAQSFEQGTIAADGSTVVSIYYERSAVSRITVGTPTYSSIDLGITANTSSGTTTFRCSPALATGETVSSYAWYYEGTSGTPVSAGTSSTASLSASSLSAGTYTMTLEIKTSNSNRYSGSITFKVTK